MDENKLNKALKMLKNKSSISEASKVAGLSYKEFFTKAVESKILSEKEITELDRDSNRNIDDILKMLE